MSVLGNAWAQAGFLAAAVVILIAAQRRSFRRKRVRYVLTCVVATLDLALCGSTLGYSLHALRSEAANPALIVPFNPHDPAAGLYISGIIGIHFAARVERHLQREPTRTLYVTSPGGYVGQATALAAVIGKQRLRVVVTGHCDGETGTFRPFRDGCAMK